METLIVESTEQLEVAFPKEKSATQELVELTVEHLGDVGGGSTYVLY
jgi:hypothetical protein